MKSPRFTQRTFGRLSAVLGMLFAFTIQGCSDNGPPPDETVKNAPPEPPKEPNAKQKGGAPVKTKSIKDRS
jgi:hypothetical protein